VVNAGRNMGLDLRTGSIEDCELGYFDIITALHVLEHTNSAKVFLNKCCCLLDERGFLLVEVPDYGSKRSLRMAQNWPYLFPDLHLYQFTVDSLTRYLAEFNFELCNIRKIGGRGPLEDYSIGADNKSAMRRSVKNALFKIRYLTYWFPGVREFVRYFLWEMLGYGEFIRVLAQKKG